MKKLAKLKVDVKTNWGLIKKDSIVVVLDDDTPLHQSYRVRPLGALDNQIFGIDKTTGAGWLEYMV